MEKINAQVRFFQILVVVILLAYLILTLVVAYDKTRIAATIDTTKAAPTDLLEINGQKSVVVNVINLIQPSLGWVAAVLGVMWSIMTFENERRKEKEQKIEQELEEKKQAAEKEREEKKQQEEREQEEKERRAEKDREEKRLQEAQDKERLLQEVQLALKDIWTGISAEKESDRAGSMARLLFLIELASNDKNGLNQTVKIQIASALAFAGRQKNSKETIETLTPVVEKAFEKFDHEVISRVSWQGLHLISPNFSGEGQKSIRALQKLNFREAILEDAHFENCDLSEANFERARLNGTNFYQSNLWNANLQYANLEGASFVESSLVSADMRRALIKDTDLRKADLEYAKLSEFVEEWRQTRNWRETIGMKPYFKKLLDRVYGGTVEEKNIMLMIAWEFLPYVSGGGWTALYHMVYNLLRSGWQIILITPLPKEFIDFSAFGNLVRMVSVFDKESAPLSIYSSIYLNTYSDMTAYQSSLIFEAEKQASIVSVSERFANNVAYWVDKIINEEFRGSGVPIKLIYSHDWLCARAAKFVKQAFQMQKRTNVPWYAHFHSLESDRQNESHRSKMIETIEREMACEADFVISPSSHTAEKIAQEFGRKDVFVLPNYLTDIEDLDYKIAKNTNLGEFDSKLVVFLGRISWQKGPDIFVRLADRVLTNASGNTAPHFLMYGRGPMEREIGEMVYQLFPQRPQIFQPLVAKNPPGVEPQSDDHAQFSRIEPVLLENSLNFNAIHILEHYGQLNEDRARVVERILFERGFQAYKLEGQQPYSHLLSMNDLEDGWHTSYLVEAPWLPAPRYSRGRTVELMGNIDWSFRFQAFRGATVVVVPSRNEPYGMVIVEAMKCGVPILYADEAGVAELFGEKIGACPASDEEGLAKELDRLLYDYDYWGTVLEKQKEQYKKLQEGTAFPKYLKLLDGFLVHTEEGWMYR